MEILYKTSRVEKSKERNGILKTYIDMNVVLIIPTGIGAEIGGHAGDALPVAKLLASTCDNLITHPNVLNASDINEMTENTLYVEGSMLDLFLENEIFLEKVNHNKILLVTNAPVKNEIINSVSAARATIGADIEVMELDTPLYMTGNFMKGKASGVFTGADELIDQVNSHAADHKFDCVAIATPIDVPDDVKERYFTEGGVNPWGGIEAMVSKYIAEKLNIPVAHSPCDGQSDMDFMKKFNEVVDPRMSAELVSVSYLHCILKGLHKAPKITEYIGLGVHDVDFLVTPINCVGRPHKACIKAGIPIIAVKENKTVLNDKMPDTFIIVENYLEAAGIIMAHWAGIDYRTVRRPLKNTIIHRNNEGQIKTK